MNISSNSARHPDRASTIRPDGAGATRDEVTDLFARALDGDPTADYELGRRAFPYLTGETIPPDPHAVEAYAALSVVDDEHDSRTGGAAGSVRTGPSTTRTRPGCAI